MRYILDDPELTGPGSYNYRWITREEMTNWLKQGPWSIRMRNEEVVKYLKSILKQEVPIARSSRWVMEPGDEALIVRRAPAVPVHETVEKGQKAPVISEEQWEFGILKRVK